MAVTAVAAPRSSGYAGTATAVKHLADTALRKQATAIDRYGVYPSRILHELGAAGAFAQLADGAGGLVDQANLGTTIDAMEHVARECVATAFCCWCQGALAWYLRSTDNDVLRRRLLAPVASGEVLGGTALSNPMKVASGLEDLLLNATKTATGWTVSGAIPWVSNIETGHPFGIVFATGQGPCMAVVEAGMEGLTIKLNDDYETMSGTATVVARLRDVPVRSDMVLAENAAAFIEQIRCGFVMIQTGIGLGIIQAAADVIEHTKRAPSTAVSSGLLSDARQLRARADRLRIRTHELAGAALDDPDRWS